MEQINSSEFQSKLKERYDAIAGSDDAKSFSKYLGAIRTLVDTNARMVMGMFDANDPHNEEHVAKYSSYKLGVLGKYQPIQRQQG